MSEVILTLPDNLAKEAEASGLFTPELAASIFRSELRRRHIHRLFSAADKLAELGDPMTDEEIMDEIKAARSEKRQKG